MGGMLTDPRDPGSFDFLLKDIFLLMNNWTHLNFMSMAWAASVARNGNYVVI